MYRIQKSNVASIEDVGKWFDTDNWAHLGVGEISSLKYMKRLIPWHMLLTGRFFPQFSNERLERVHLLFVTKKILYHVYVGNSKVLYSEYPIINVSCRLEFIYNATGSQIISVMLYFDIGEQKQDGRPHIHYLEVPAEAKTQAISLISLINHLKADQYGYQDD
jgi:hypothetical protein